MKLSVKHLRRNETTCCEDEVSPGTPFGFWQIVEHTGAGWFPWPGLYSSRAAAEQALDRALARNAAD